MQLQKLRFTLQHCVCPLCWQLRDGYVTVALQRGQDTFLSCLDAWRANDGEWHHLQVELRGGGTAAPYQAILSLDYGLNMVSRAMACQATLMSWVPCDWEQP